MDVCAAAVEYTTSLAIASVQEGWSVWKVGFPAAFGAVPLNRYCLPIFPSGRKYIEVTLSELHIGTSLLPFVVLVTRELEEGHSEANSNFSCFTGAVKHLDIGVEGHSVTFLL